eukprot:INCI18855.1.p1 GENE.INCI18855.1~~INCI18855.1.p1  ORF type:complete len:149 (+),score=9.62 INCI18855.1:3-449(+)
MVNYGCSLSVCILCEIRPAAEMASRHYWLAFDIECTVRAARAGDVWRAHGASNRGWRCDCRPGGRLGVNGALDLERLEDMQHGDVMHAVSLDDEPFHGLCCSARQGRIIQWHDAIRDLLANTLNALEEVTVEQHHMRCMLVLYQGARA